MRQATNERTEIHDQFREYPLQRNWQEVWYDEQLRSMVHNSPFVNNVADVIVDVGKC